MYFLIIDEGDELLVPHSLELEEIKLVAFRPTKRALCWEDQNKWEEAQVKMKELGIKFELP